MPPADVDSAVVPEGDGGGDGIGEGGDRALGEQRALAQYLHVRLDPQAALAALRYNGFRLHAVWFIRDSNFLTLGVSLSLAI